jgi:hypothetical protein
VNDGSVVVDSSNAAAVVVTGNGKVTAPLFDLTAGAGPSTTSNRQVVGPVQGGQAPTAAPLASLAAPNPSSLPV